MGWGGDGTGMFSISSAYNFVHGNANNEGDDIWEKIWKIKVPNRMKVFIWLARHQKIMCNAERKKRGFAGNDWCHRCPSKVENVEHILRGYPRADVVWRRIAPTRVQKSNWNDDFSTWLDENIKGKDSKVSGRDWSADFTMVV